MDFNCDFLDLEELQERSQSLYDQVKSVLTHVKNSGSSIIGHPLLRLQNKLISLNYSILNAIIKVKYGVSSAGTVEGEELYLVVPEYSEDDYRSMFFDYEQEFLDLKKQHIFNITLCA